MSSDLVGIIDKFIILRNQNNVHDSFLEKSLNFQNIQCIMARGNKRGNERDNKKGNEKGEELLWVMGTM